MGLEHQYTGESAHPVNVGEPGSGRCGCWNGHDRKYKATDAAKAVSATRNSSDIHQSLRLRLGL
jgi:hypothetical protein